MRKGGTLLQALVDSAGVHPEVAVDGEEGLVDARVLDAGDQRVLIAINHDEAAHTVRLRLASDLAGRRWTGLDGASIPSPAAVIAWSAKPRDVLVLVGR